MKQTFIIIDGHSQIYRAYFAPFQNLSTRCLDCKGRGRRDHKRCGQCNGSGEEPTKATFVFTGMLITLLNKMKPAFLAMAMDGPRDRLLRRDIHPGYKAERGEAAWDVKPQIRRCEQIARLLGVPVLRSEGYEADDVIATLVEGVKDEPGLEVVIVTKDKDLCQLVNEWSTLFDKPTAQVRLYDPMSAEYTDEQAVKNKFGVAPHQMQDYLTLCGDAGDCVPGVPGVGAKTAAELLGQYGNIEDMIVACSMNRVSGKLAEKLVRSQANGTIARARKLVGLATDVPLDVEPGMFKWSGLNLAKAKPFFKALGFRRWS